MRIRGLDAERYGRAAKMMFRVLCVAIICAGQSVLAQDLAVYRVNATPGPWNDATRSLGYSVSLTRRLTEESGAAFGLRASFSESRDSAMVGGCPFCTSFVASMEQIRLRTTELVMVFLPYATRATRFELGMGIARYNFSGFMTNEAHAPLMTMSLARRLMPRLPVWATVGYTMYQETDADSWPQDGPSADTPTKSVRFGLLLRR
jgi:hypothetical protein